MAEQENVKIAQQTYELFKSGNVPAFLELYSEDITFQLPEIEKVPFAGSHKGRAALAAFVQSVSESQDALAFNPVEFIAQGDKVVVLGNYSWRVKATGREYSSDWAHIVTFSDGKISAFKEYMDTGTAAAAYQ